MLMVSSSKNLELVDDGTVPKALIKETNEAVDLLKKADEKMQSFLDMYLPNRKSTSSNKSKASSKRSKTSSHKPVQPT
jgi:hypothetical protein